MPKLPKGSLAGQARRAGAKGRSEARFEWYINNVMRKVRMTLHKRVSIAAQHLQTKIVKNISKPVGKIVLKGKTAVTGRSKRGEFPRADTTLLMKSIFIDVQKRGRDIVDAYVGTTLDYGLILEVSKKMNRSFLLRTFKDEAGKIKRIIDGPIK